MAKIAWQKRVLTAAVGIPIALSLLICDVGMLLLATTFCSLSLIEFTNTVCPRIVSHKPKAATEKMLHCLFVVTLGAVLCTGAWTGVKAVYDVFHLGAMLAISAFHMASAQRMDQTVLIELLLDLFALQYIVCGFGHAILLRYSSSKYGLGLQILGLCCAWVCDSAALVAGTWMGETKLAPLVSPGKTLVGALAGVVSTVLTVVGFFGLSNHIAAMQPITELLPSSEVVPLSHQVLIGVVISVLSIVGDLVESFLKRVAGLKDSGTFFPGHGGCLDRMDSFLFVAPLLYFYSQFALS
ncbi:hypothetical protein PsorP6_014400 [Peronosclerospora sorghi]|uniref:Uncharacterized protein n=1 Tax=Peronosclerospora sorghi TaxID=230839 RepID=A0ACC0VHP0_9STRA|nr:hypothetical protein PsorP6_014400 [Peronosclerospora sorghi]